MNFAFQFRNTEYCTLYAHIAVFTFARRVYSFLLFPADLC